MNCYECGGLYQEKSDLLEILDPYVGKISIQGIPYYQCENCHDILYTEEMSRAIETKRNERIHELISQFPIGDFSTAAEAASILGISRQALHKNRRINYGFIHQTKFGGVSIYLRQSVLQFKKTGDGRYPLYLHGYKNVAPYVPHITRGGLIFSSYLQQSTTWAKKPKFINTFGTLKENSYAK
ncbi:hypothetical protein ACFLWO_00605 [Chloroflexota bacterium]